MAAPDGAPSWLPTVLWEVLMFLADAYRSDGVAALLLSVPTAVFSAMAKIPGLTRDLNAVAFAISVGLLLLVTPVLIYALLRYIFALPTVGPARKTLSYTLVLLLWWALPLLGSVILALIWTVLGFLVMVFIVLLPLVATIAGLYYLLTGVEDSIQDQRRRFAEMGAEVEDITFVELGFALVAATVAACTVAPLVVLLALLKFPLVFLGVMLKVGHNVGSILGEMVKNAPWSCVCVLPFFLVAMAFMLLLAVLMLPISLVVKFVVAIYWPAYVACGWLRTVGSRRQHRDCGTILLETAKAAYQVLWFSDIITNAAVLMRFDLAAAARDQFVALAKGECTSLSAEVQAVSWMPPVVIGVLDQQRGTWRVELQRIARAINVPVDTLGKAWDGFFAQLSTIGKGCIDRELLTAEYVAEYPPPLLIGLPSLVLLQLVVRSPKGEDVLRLSDGTRVDRRSFARAPFADEAWKRLMEAKTAYEAAVEAKALPAGEAQLEAVLLAGGAPADELPDVLAAAVASSTSGDGELPPLLSALHKPLVAVVYKMAQQHIFKNDFQSRVYEPLAQYRPPRAPPPPPPPAAESGRAPAGRSGASELL